MAGEITSALATAESHVADIKAATANFAEQQQPTVSDQENNPSVEMRNAYAEYSALVKDLSSFLSRDIEKITIMSKEFEALDEEVATQ